MFTSIFTNGRRVRKIIKKDDILPNPNSYMKFFITGSPSNDHIGLMHHGTPKVVIIGAAPLLLNGLKITLELDEGKVGEEQDFNI